METDERPEIVFIDRQLMERAIAADAGGPPRRYRRRARQLRGIYKGELAAAFAEARQRFGIRGAVIALLAHLGVTERQIEADLEVLVLGGPISHQAVNQTKRAAWAAFPEIDG